MPFLFLPPEARRDGTRCQQRDHHQDQEAERDGDDGRLAERYQRAPRRRSRKRARLAAQHPAQRGEQADDDAPGDALLGGPLQNSSITRAGRLAEAAMLKAQPTRKVALRSLNRMPSAIATRPTTTAASLAMRTWRRRSCRA